MENLTPDNFKQRVLSANPSFANGVSSDGIKYSDMDSTDFTKRLVAKNPDAITKDGHKYSDFLPKTPEISDTTNNDSLLGKLGGRFNDIGGTFNDSMSGKISPISGGIQAVGAVGGAINDVVGAGLENTPILGGLIKKGEDWIGSGVNKLAQTDTGQKVVGAVGDFAQKHPEISADIGAFANTVGAATTLEGGGFLKKLITGGLTKAVGGNVLKDIISDVAPEVGAKAGISNVAKQGVTKSLITGTIKPAITKADEALGKIVADNVPGFSKLKTFSDKLNLTRKTVYDMADKLKQQVITSGQDIIYPFKELAAKMSALEPSIAIKADTILQKQFDLAKQAALKIAKDQGGKISNLFDARKAFDDLVAKQFPNLYDRANAPMRDAITQMRRTMNDFIESKLPPGSGFKDSLKIQSNLFKAIENMSPRAYEEIGTNNFTRFTGKHPIVTGLIKKGATGAAITAGGGALYGGYKSLTDQ